MMKNPVSLDTVYIYIYIRQQFIAFSNNTYCTICEFFDGFVRSNFEK